MINKRGIFPWAPIMAMLLTSIALPAPASEEPASKGKAAVVNGSVITVEDLNWKMDIEKRRLLSQGRSPSGPQLLEMKKKVLESLINVELLHQEAKRQGIKVSDSAINDQFEIIKKRFPSEEKFKSSITGMNLSEGALRSQIKKSLAIQQFIEKKFFQGLTVSDKEIKAYYDGNPKFFNRPDQVKASHILIKVDSGASDSQKAAARKKIKEIRQKLQKGENFADLAKKFSEGPSGAKGGDLGYFRRGQMLKPFEEVAFALKPGQISDVVETRFGYHLIKVIDKKSKDPVAYEEVKDKIQQHLKQQKSVGAISRYIEEVKGKAKVQRFLN